MKKALFAFLLVMYSLVLTSCEAIAGIFKAGMGFGIFIVIAIIVLVVIVIARSGKRGDGA